MKRQLNDDRAASKAPFQPWTFKEGKGVYETSVSNAIADEVTPPREYRGLVADFR